MKILFSVCALAALTGCANVDRKERVQETDVKTAAVRALMRLDETRQRAYLRKAERFKEKIGSALGLAANATWEQHRVALAKRLLISETTAWEVLLEQPVIKNELTEQKRLEFTEVFRLPLSASWIDIKDELERRRGRQER